jgi:hypothetical protein
MASNDRYRADRKANVAKTRLIQSPMRGPVVEIPRDDIGRLCGNAAQSNDTSGNTLMIDLVNHLG